MTGYRAQCASAPTRGGNRGARENGMLTAGKWAVDVYVCGFFCGSYFFDSESEAAADAKERRGLFGVLRCGYVVRPVEAAC